VDPGRLFLGLSNTVTNLPFGILENRYRSIPDIFCTQCASHRYYN
jgi:hypothetical protein